MKSTAYSFFLKLLIALVIALLFKLIFLSIEGLIGPDLILISIVIVFLWEGNKQIDLWLNKKYSWIEFPQKRLIAQAIAFMLFTALTLFLLMYTLHQIRFRDGVLVDRKMREIFFPAIFFALAFISIYVGSDFFKSWKKSLLEVEKYKTQSAEAQLQNLKNQINPHFLFNNLSVLSSLVYQNQDKAVNFINELSKVYRYVLDNKNAELVSLADELAFLKHYTYLLKIRFETAVDFSVNIAVEDENRFLPPMCLQVLVENTIQHNEASLANPLRVKIYTHDQALVIENNIQLRSDKVASTKTGLKNITSRYAYFAVKKPQIVNDGNIFKVILPLMIQE
jgi:sensor histidine kinase YesM